MSGPAPSSVYTRTRPLSAAASWLTCCCELPDKPVDMVLDGARVSPTCVSARFSLQTMPVEEYPNLPDMPAATGTVDVESFAHAVSRVPGGHRRGSRLHHTQST